MILHKYCRLCDTFTLIFSITNTLINMIYYLKVKPLFYQERQENAQMKIVDLTASHQISNTILITDIIIMF